LLIISAIILVIGILLSFLLSRRLVKDLRYLSDITEKISTGMMERSIKIKSKDEVGELAESLERMRISLKMAMEMIEKEQEGDEEH
jgi:methyl-accepting chemotaxis protein